MKKILCLMFIIALTTSCKKEVVIEIDKSNEPLKIGTWNLENGDSGPIFTGDVDNQKIWVDYIKAHNIRDLDKIAEINSDEWEGYAPNGLTIKGNKAHIEFLDNWFKTSSPKWNIRWMMANSGEDENGEMTQWLTTANDLKDVDEQGNEIIEHHVHDVQFENGKIKKIYVYSRSKAQE